jgi:hypothetical protein
VKKENAITEIFRVWRSNCTTDAKVVSAEVEQVHRRDGVLAGLQGRVLDEAVTLKVDFNDILLDNIVDWSYLVKSNYCILTSSFKRF